MPKPSVSPVRELSPLEMRIAAFGPAIIALVLGASVLGAVIAAHDTRERVAHSHQVIQALDHTMLRLVDAETGVRGYVITFDSSYLTPFAQARTDVQAGVSRLRTLSVDSPDQQRRLDTLQRLATIKLRMLDSGIHVRQTKGLAVMLAPPVSPRGKATMDSIRATVADMRADEATMLQARTVAEDARTRFVIMLVIAGSLAAACLALLVNGLLSRFATTRASMARELEQANGAKMEFLATMSHELRTPLNAIDGYTELLAMGTRGPVTPEQRTDLERIRNSGRYLLSLINDILNFAKLEAGRIDLHVTNVRVDQLLATIDELVMPQIAAKGVTYHRASVEPDLTVRADGDKLRQIVLNLLTNAVKFTPRGGSITLECEREEQFVHVLVQDTGRGIPADRLNIVFDPFVQVERTLATPGMQHGVGLGLAISRDLARQMGGDLTADSVVGAGSTFRFSVPRVASGVVAAAAH